VWLAAPHADCARPAEHVVDRAPANWTVPLHRQSARGQPAGGRHGARCRAGAVPPRWLAADTSRRDHSGGGGATAQERL